MLHEEARQEQAKNRNTPEYFSALRLRKIWCEGNFSHQKAEHNLRRTYKRGIERVTEQCLLSACAMNLIRLVKAANAVFFRCLGVIVQGLFHVGYLSTAPKLYRLPGALGNIGLISPVKAHFCGDCNRIRLTADGKVKSCLHSNVEYALKGLDFAGMRGQLEKAIWNKPAWHGNLDAVHRSQAGRNMNQIGG